MASYPHPNEPNAQNKNRQQNNDVDVDVKQQPTTAVETQQHAIISTRLRPRRTKIIGCLVLPERSSRLQMDVSVEAEKNQESS